MLGNHIGEDKGKVTGQRVIILHDITIHPLAWKRGLHYQT